MKIKILFVFLLIFTATSAHAFERNKFGIGVMAGDPSGITAKYMLDNTNGIDFAVGWSTSGSNEYYFSSDYLFHIYDVVQISKIVSPLYWGGGVRYINREKRDNKFGLRIPVGIEFLFLNNRLGAFGELVPLLDFTPDTDFDVEFGIGVRFFF